MGSGWGDTTGAGVLNNWGRRDLKVGAYKAVVYGIGSGGSHRVPFVQTQFPSFCGHFLANATGLIPKQDLLLPLTLGRTRKFIPTLWYKRGGRGCVVFDRLQYFETILPLVESL